MLPLVGWGLGTSSQEKHEGLFLAQLFSFLSASVRDSKTARFRVLWFLIAAVYQKIKQFNDYTKAPSARLEHLKMQF